ncbi:uncharacterized protein L203_101103 [Cryptococcus depauperatus CBS 7841]|uniref:Uncharacterized protein n=1 Tax=Cryptococcus depauperatus CBS 7841 TaxID=1295531 RepID=A0A1E3IKR4_9TREE|nr:hypothetical protein L203_02432 [Cryptococcus depauperatus CBS 7841]
MDDNKEISNPLFYSSDSTRLSQSSGDNPIQGELKDNACSTAISKVGDTWSQRYYDDTIHSYGYERSGPPVVNTIPFSRSLTIFSRRLIQLLSIILGTSSAIAAIWSLFILPLIHSSFSARRALTDQQNERMTLIVKGLQKLKENVLYSRSREASEIERPQSEMSAENVHGGSLSELDLLSASISSYPSMAKDDAHDKFVPLSNLTSLSQSLRKLTSALDSTSTTRSSLISTLESYTSHLHRQLFVARPTSGVGSHKYSIGLGSLSANLRDEGEIKSNGEEWDAVRKEVRAIKGLLLNRRSFASTASKN